MSRVAYRLGIRAMLTAYVALILGACAAPSSSDEALSQALSEGSIRPVADERTQGSSPFRVALKPADALAKTVFEASGGAAMEQVAGLQFAFVVQQGPDRVFSARHDWDLTSQRDRVSWADRHGKSFEVLVDLTTRTALEAKVAGQPAEVGQLEELGAQAYQRWVNDSYWLMMPLKLQDPGVVLEKHAAQEIEGKTFHVLAARYESVGLTPGDRYEILVDDSGRVQAWDMRLEASTSGEAVRVFWGDWRPVGPLTLAHERVWAEGERRIVFEDVQVRLK